MFAMARHFSKNYYYYYLNYDAKKIIKIVRIFAEIEYIKTRGSYSGQKKLDQYFPHNWAAMTSAKIFWTSISHAIEQLWLGKIFCQSHSCSIAWEILVCSLLAKIWPSGFDVFYSENIPTILDNFLGIIIQIFWKMSTTMATSVEGAMKLSRAFVAVFESAHPLMILKNLTFLGNGITTF